MYLNRFYISVCIYMYVCVEIEDSITRKSRKQRTDRIESLMEIMKVYVSNTVLLNNF